MITNIELDHVAIAVEEWSHAWPTVVGQLGGKWRSGGFNVGFAPAQLSFANNMRLEVLAPHEPLKNDFLKRFLEHSGPGPHHLTFKVKDLESALEEVRSKGYSPTGVSLENPWWKEAFIHPKEALGVVVQLAQSAGSWFVPPPEGVPMPEEGIASELLFIAHAISDLNAGLSFFSDLLGGEEVVRGECDDDMSEWIELAWKGPGRIRLIWAKPEFKDQSPITNYLNGRSGKIAYIAFGVEDPSKMGDITAKRLPGQIEGGIPLKVSEQVNVPMLLLTSKSN